MDFKELDTLVKYCINKINYDEFIKLMLPIYNDENYIDSLWSEFRDNPCVFMVSRTETELFKNIMEEIRNTGYKG